MTRDKNIKCTPERICNFEVKRFHKVKLGAWSNRIYVTIKLDWLTRR